MVADSTILIEIKSDGTGARVIKRDLDEIAGKSEKTTKSVFNLRNAFVALGGVLSVGAVARFADSITELDTKLNNVSKSSAQANKSFADLFQVAQRNGDAVGGLVDVYSKLSAVLPDNVKAGNDLVKTTELLSRGLAATGANAQTAQGVLLQLSQGLAGNFESSAQELNSLIEGAPVLAKVIAEQLGGKSATDLKRFAEAGELTADSFLKALAAAEGAIKRFEIPSTISRSITRISNEFVRLGRESEVLRGFSALTAKALDGLAASLDTVIKLVGVLIGASMPVLIRQFAVLLPAAIAATTTAFGVLTGIIAANPIGAIAVGISAAISAFFLFRKEIFETLRGVEVFGVGVTDIFFGIKNTAIEVFKSLVNTITLPFRIAINVIKSEFAKLKVLAFQGLDFSNRAFGTEFGLDFLNQNDIALSRQNIGQIAINTAKETFLDNAGLFDRAVSRTKKDIADFAKITDETGLTDTGLGKPPSVNSPLSKTLDGVSKKTKEFKNELDDFAKDFGQNIIDAFAKGFEGGSSIMGQFLNGVSGAFSSLYSQIANATGRQIATAAGGLIFGGGAGAIASSGGGGLGSIGSLASSLLNGGLYSSTLGNVGAKIGANLFGGGQLLSSGGFIGAQALGNLGYGAIGGGIANLLGLGGGIGGTIGGTLGSIAGGGIGASLGTIAGFAGGPVGAIVGSFLGSALGGLFGGKKPSDKAQTASLDTMLGSVTFSGQSGDKFSQENKDFAGAVAQEGARLSQLLQSAGATIKSIGLGVTVGNRDGLRLVNTETGITQNFGNNSSALIQAVAQAVVGSIVDAPEDLQSVLRNVSGYDTAQVAEAIGILELVRSFEKVGEAVSPLTDLLDTLDAQFEDLRKKALDLGLPVDKLTESYERQKKTLIQDTLRPLQDFLDNQALSGSSSLNDIQRLTIARSAFDENLSRINAGDFTNLNQITSQASQLLNIGRNVFASGEGFSSLESFVRQSIGGIAETLGAPAGSLNDEIVREITLSNATQTSLIQQMNTEIQALAEENRKLRKSMERIGNQLVVMTA